MCDKNIRRRVQSTASNNFKSDSKSVRSEPQVKDRGYGGKVGHFVASFFYLSWMSLRFMRQGLFLKVEISFFFSSTSSFRAAISPSDRDSSSDSEEEELPQGESCHVPWLGQDVTAETSRAQTPNSSSFSEHKNLFKLCLSSNCDEETFKEDKKESTQS